MSSEAGGTRKSGGTQIMGLPVFYYIIIMAVIVFGYLLLSQRRPIISSPDLSFA